MAAHGDAAQVPLPPGDDDFDQEGGAQQHVPPPPQLNPQQLQQQFAQFLAQQIFQQQPLHVPPAPPAPQPHKVKLSPFWPSKARAWFTHAEADFDTFYVYQSRARFNLVLKVLPEEALERIAAIVEHPDQLADPYLALKTRLLEVYQMDPWESSSKLLHFRELGDWKPSQMMDAMLNLYQPNHLFKAIFLARIPADMRDHVQREAERLEPRELAAYADTIWQARNANRSDVLAALPAAQQHVQAGDVVEDLSEAVAALNVGKGRSQHPPAKKKWGKRPPAARQGGGGNSKQQGGKGGVVCWRHLKFKENAWGCEDPNCYLFPGN